MVSVGLVAREVVIVSFVQCLWLGRGSLSVWSRPLSTMAEAWLLSWSSGWLSAWFSGWSSVWSAVLEIVLVGLSNGGFVVARLGLM